MENLNIPNIRKACELLDMPIEKFIETLNLEDEDIIQIFEEEDIND